MRLGLELRGAESGTDVAATAAYEGPGAPAGAGTEGTAGGAETTTEGGTGAVSYTHLDVYKRQALFSLWKYLL